MNIGIYDLNECSLLNYKERLKIYKDSGFTSVGLYLDDNYMVNKENYVDIIEYARKIDLKINQVHIDYKISNMICDNPDVYFAYVENKIEECIKLDIPFLVLHASKGENAPLLNPSTLNRLKCMMDKYSDKNIYLCFENVRDNRNLKMILDYNIKNIGMCYDLGHAYCYDDVRKLLETFKEKILCTHLHNNYKKDTHNTLFDGDIDCYSIINRFEERIDNCLEIFPDRGVVLDKINFELFVKKCYIDYKKCKGNFKKEGVNNENIYNM